MRLRLSLFRVLPLLLAWLVFTPAWGAGVVHLLASEEGGAYRDAGEAFRSALAGSRPIRTWVLAELDAARMRALTGENDLIVPIGLKAARFVAEHHSGKAAVLTLMLPRLSGERLTWPASLPRRRISHVYIDQPASRLLGLVEAAFPSAARVGLVVSAENADTVKVLQQEAARRRIELNVDVVASPDEVASALRSVLPEADVLLLLPDALAMHAGNAQNVLLTTYRYRVPAIGFSAGLSRAGAVASVYASPAQIGQQGAILAARWKPETGELPPAQHADEFSVAFNANVARSLGVGLPDLNEVRRKLGARED